ncbi:putative membrane protein, partial [Vibrio parahaemolyticus V-223/04]
CARYSICIATKFACSLF